MTVDPISILIGLAVYIAFAGTVAIWRIDKMTEASENLAREVQETREAVTALTGRYQTKIDAMQVEIDTLKDALANGDTDAANAAVAALDALQTEMAELGQTPAAPTEPTGDAEVEQPEG